MSSTDNRDKKIPLHLLRYDAERGTLHLMLPGGRWSDPLPVVLKDRAALVRLRGRWVSAAALVWRIEHGEWPRVPLRSISGLPWDLRGLLPKRYYRKK